MRAAEAVAPNLPYSPQERLPVREFEPLARSKSRCRWRGTPPRHDAKYGSQWRFLRSRASTPPKMLGGVAVWRIDGPQTPKPGMKQPVIVICLAVRSTALIEAVSKSSPILDRVWAFHVRDSTPPKPLSHIPVCFVARRAIKSRSRNAHTRKRYPRSGKILKSP